MHEILVSPLLDADSPLDDRQKDVVRRVHEAERAKAVTLPTDAALDEQRRRRVELTRDEMWTQPEAIATTLDREGDAIRQVAKQVAARELDRVALIGCGDSLAVMVGLRGLLEHVLGVPCEPLQSLDFAYYAGALADERSLVVALSSSGETTRTVEAALVAQRLGAFTLALTNTEGSTLMQESDLTLRVHATRRGWPTQASTAAMALLARLALDVAQVGPGRVDARSLDRHEQALADLPDQVGAALQRHDAAVRQAATATADRRVYLACAGGPAYACAMFGAAKVKECSPDHAVAIPLEEYHHYNSQKEGDPLLLTVPPGRTVSRARDTAEEARRVGGLVHLVHAEGDDRLTGLADAAFALPPVPELLAPVLYTVPSQLFAYHLAMAKFRAAEGAGG